jgi:hypothetical protein
MYQDFHGLIWWVIDHKKVILKSYTKQCTKMLRPFLYKKLKVSTVFQTNNWYNDENNF